MDTTPKSAKRSRPNVREVALRALILWDSKKENFDLISDDLIQTLPKENRPFFTELTKGVLRNLLQLDFKLEHIAKRPLESLPLPIRNILRLGAYQLDHIHIPKPVTVNLMVELTKTHGHPGTVRLVNGVLRKWASGVQVPLPEEPIKRLSITHSHPEWLVERWVSRFGFEKTRSLLEWNNSPSSLEVCINTLRITPKEFVEICQEEEVTLERTLFDEAFALKVHRPIEKIPGYKEGFFWIQSVAALIPVKLLAPHPHEKITDLCAAPGGKSCQIANLMNDEGEILAVDRNEERLKKVEENRRRLGLRSIQATLADGRDFGSFFPEAMDAVLVDAPCSGTGVFRRKVDARWSRSLEQIQKLQEEQLELLESANDLLKKGGRIVYSTCSLEPEENQEVIKRFLSTHQAYSLEEPSIQTLPHEDNLDGFFVAKLRKND